MARASRYINATDVVVNGTAAEIFGTPETGRIGVRIVLLDEDPDARVYVGGSNAVTATEKVLALLGPGQSCNIECSDQQNVFLISDGSNRDVTAWEVMDS